MAVVTAELYNRWEELTRSGFEPRRTTGPPESPLHESWASPPKQIWGVVRVQVMVREGRQWELSKNKIGYYNNYILSN